MKKIVTLILAIILSFQHAKSQDPRTTINLNGKWDFDQTTTAFPPEKFTRTIPVPGLIHLAEPKIVEYDKFFKRADKAEAREQFNLYNLDYTPRYSWYRKKLVIPKELEGKSGMITIKKSQYVTQVYINGIDLGSSMACYTPIEFPVNKAIKFGAENEILIKVGERVWLPAQAAGTLGFHCAQRAATIKPDQPRTLRCHTHGDGRPAIIKGHQASMNAEKPNRPRVINGNCAWKLANTLAKTGMTKILRMTTAMAMAIITKMG